MISNKEERKRCRQTLCLYNSLSLCVTGFKYLLLPYFSVISLSLCLTHTHTHSIRLLAEKRGELGEQVSKLRNGLFKIDETRSKVEAMSVELEDSKKKVAEFQKQCEEYLVIIVQQKREADEQQKVIGR